MLRRFLRDYLALTSRERNGFIILAAGVFAMLLLRSTMPLFIRGGESPDRAFTVSAEGYRDSATCFQFDPNNAGMEELLDLGFSRHTAQTLINYRQKGGEFIRKEDLRKVFGLREKDYLRLEPYIGIPSPGNPDDYEKEPAAKIRNRNPASGPGTTGNRTCSQVPGRFEINGADTSILKTVIGIGPVFARRIVKYRDLLGGYYTIDQLREVYGLSMEQFDELSKHSHADSTLLRRINLNKVSLEVLKRHPYLDPYQAAALLSYRNTAGSFKSLDEILENRLLPPDVFRRVSPYLVAGK